MFKNLLLNGWSGRHGEVVQELVQVVTGPGHDLVIIHKLFIALECILLMSLAWVLMIAMVN